MQRESLFNQFVSQQLQPFAQQFPIQFLQGEKNCRIAYRHFIQPQTQHRKLMILVNGRAENILKWTEVAYDFYQQGYDVLLFDHRGQGYSQRLLADSEKGYIDEFSFYIKDMAKVIEKCTALYAYQRQDLLAHSLGALIAADYLAHYDHQIQRAIFCSPFFALPLKNPLRDEILLSLMLIFGQGKKYVFGKTSYQPVDIQHNKLSSSQVRMENMNKINQQYVDIHLGGPTFRWAHLCLQASKKLPKTLAKIEIPVLILQAENEQIVCNKNLEKLTAVLAKGNLHKINHAKHELLFESDSIRNQVFQFINQFLM